MRNLVFLNNGEAVTSSRLIANKFNKRHCDVLRRLRNMKCSTDFTARNFALSEYLDDSGKRNSEYIITRDGFVFLVMGFTGQDAARFKEEYINRFNEMERHLKTKTSSLDVMQAMLDNLKEQKQVSDNHEKRLYALEQRSPVTSEYCSIAGYANLIKRYVPRPLAIVLGKKAASICRTKGIIMGKVPDERYGHVRSYPKLVLQKVFNEA
ncbi:MAG: Rha family transcriptional regulator [bacterium]